MVGDGAEERQPGLALAVLHERELAGSDADRGTQLIEGQAGVGAEMPHALPEGRQIVHELQHTERSGDLSTRQGFPVAESRLTVEI